MKRPLFDVVISVSGDTETGAAGFYDVQIIDRYHTPTNVVGEKTDLRTLNDAMAFARGAVTAFLEGTVADDD